MFFSVSKSLLPVKLEIDNAGYDGLWFVCVFLVAAYMRLYGIPFLQKGKRAALCYLGGCVLIYGLTLGVRMVYLKTGRLGHFIHAPYDYNHILNLFAAISLFYAFSDWKLSGERFMGRVILRVVPYTLGVYLLHEHIELRSLWPFWLGAASSTAPGRWLPGPWAAWRWYLPWVSWWIWSGERCLTQRGKFWAGGGENYGVIPEGTPFDRGWLVPVSNGARGTDIMTDPGDRKDLFTSGKTSCGVPGAA